MLAYISQITTVEAIAFSDGSPESEDMAIHRTHKN